MTPDTSTSTNALVRALVAYINDGKNIQAEEELYADTAISYEQDGTVAVGKQAVIEKTKAAFANVEQMFGGGVQHAFVGPDSFLLVLTMDVQFKGAARATITEYGYYRVDGGKIVEERFFAQPLA